MKTVKKVLGNRVMIKMVENTVETESDLVFRDDGESLPLGEIIMLGADITQVEIGDRVHYTVARESGKCTHEGESHYIIPIANVVAIIDE